MELLVFKNSKRENLAVELISVFTSSVLPMHVYNLVMDRLSVVGFYSALVDKRSDESRK